MLAPFPPPAPSCSPALALPSPPSGKLAVSFLPITLLRPCVEIHWGQRHVWQLPAEQCTAQQHSPPPCPHGWAQVEMDTDLWRMCRGLPTWSCFPQMTCVGALILLMFSWRECLDFSSTISKNTSGAREESVLQGDVLPSLLKGGPVGQSCQYLLTGKPMQR